MTVDSSHPADLAVAEVAVAAPVDGPFHYAIPANLQGRLRVGHRVSVPFGRRRSVGFVVDPRSAPPPGLKLKPVESLLDEEPLPPSVLELARFASKYYVAPLGEVLKTALPPALTTAEEARLRVTAKGRDLLAQTGREPGEAVQALQRMSKGPVPLRRIPSRTRTWLLQRGLCELTSAATRRSDPSVERVERAAATDEAWPHLRRSFRRRRIWEQLELGPLPVSLLLREPADRRAVRDLRKLGLVRAAPAAVAPEGFEGPGAAASGLVLSAEQAEAVQDLSERLEASEPGAVLLEGVTGSGKTEVYLRVVEAALRSGRGALVMVPEIGLTPRVEALFEGRFPGQVVTLHSGLGPAERIRRWNRLRSGEARVALGPRSAVWAPVAELAVLVVDEEHDASYKQSSEVRYHGRDLALVRGRNEGALVVLASATPSLETKNQVMAGRIGHLRLAHRPTGHQLPQVRIVDLLEERRMNRSFDIFSRSLADDIRDCISRKEQVILFLNRRGLHPFVSCGTCGDLAACPRCDLTLTLHGGGRLQCHTCGYGARLQDPCSKCGMQDPLPFGAGTQRVAESLQEIAPQATVLRLDRDAATTSRQVERTLSAFRDRRADVLVGTKMVTKGHDFPGVTLVGILMADASLAFPDFRASESTFQLLTQVAGRAGRGDRPGRVVVQTLQPEHPALVFSMSHDVDGFSAQELQQRREAGYPPFGRLALVRCEGKDPERVVAACHHLAEAVGRHPEVRILGPTEAPIARIKERHRHRFLVRCARPSSLLEALWSARRTALPSGVDRIIDVDPHDFL